MLITIENHCYCVKIDTKGAELQSFFDKTKALEYIWEGDSRYWSGRSPVLFPIVGNARNDRILIDGRYYSIPKHGIVRNRAFTVVHQTPTEVVFECHADDQSKENYPFDFNLRMIYTLQEDKLKINYEVQNNDTVVMPYCFGTHPAFRCPLYPGEDFSDYVIEFEHKENDESLIYDVDKREINSTQTVNVLKNEKYLPLKYHLFDHDALIFDDITSKSVKLYHQTKGYGILLRFYHFHAIGFWTPDHKNAPFICLEPWNGMAVRGDETDNFAQKRWVKELKPGNTEHYELEFLPIYGR